MGFINQLLFKSLSQQHYLKLLNTSFLTLYRTGLLRANSKYQYHYFAVNLVREGDVAIDLGANLGYYANLIHRWIGSSGHLYAVEPVIPFNNILNWRLGTKKNVTIYPYAVGTEEKDITLVIPKDLGYLSTGLPNVHDESTHGKLDDYGFKFEARMKKGSELFGSLPKVDFVKCDIEGYEEFVLPEMRTLFEKHRPIVQVETWGNHKKVVEELFNGLGYVQYYLHKGKLLPTAKGYGPSVVDFIFIHPGNAAAVEKTRRFLVS